MYVDFDAKKKRIEDTLEAIFDKYKDNGFFEDMEPSDIAIFIFNNRIRFVPNVVKDEVQELIDTLASLEKWRVSMEAKTERIPGECGKTSHTR